MAPSESQGIEVGNPGKIVSTAQSTEVLSDVVGDGMKGATNFGGRYECSKESFPNGDAI